MNRNIHMLLGTLLAAAFVMTGVGCGGTSGVDDSEELLSLNDQEVEALCRESVASSNGIADKEDEIVRAGCELFGAVSESTVQACEDSVPACVANASDDEDLFERIDPDSECRGLTAEEEFEGCEGVTVGEWRGCLNALTRDLNQVIDEASCNLVGDTNALKDIAEKGEDIEEFSAPECEVVFECL